jgi:squalene-associated FAD-dependent desaturase
MEADESPHTGTEHTRVCVIGGGIAGLAAAVFLKHNKFDVILIESSPRLGGRAYSFFDKNMNRHIDNGQHILASWYNSTFEFLKIIGTFDKLGFQKRLEVKFVDLSGNRYHFKCPKLPPPFHLTWGLWTYKALRWNDKTGILKLVNSVVFNKFPEERLKGLNVLELFEFTKQSERVIEYFWKPFIVAVFNAEPKETSAWQFMQILKIGFLRKNASNLVFPKSNLNSLYVEAAEKYLIENKVCILKGSKIEKLNFDNDNLTSIKLENNNNLNFDYYISAVPFFEFRNLVGDETYLKDFEILDNLTPSPIVNVHHIYRSRNRDTLFKEDFVGVIGGTSQWIFKVNESADGGQICVVISSAKGLIDKDKDELIELTKEEINLCLHEFRNADFIYSRVVKEKRATFLPDVKSVSSRPKNKTRFKNFFIAGDWTDTGYPATLESSVKSALNCVNEIRSMRTN